MLKNLTHSHRRIDCLNRVGLPNYTLRNILLYRHTEWDPHSEYTLKQCSSGHWGRWGRWSQLITLITCLKGSKSLSMLYGSDFQQCGFNNASCEWVSEWRGNLLSCLGTAKNLSKYLVNSHQSCAQFLLKISCCVTNLQIYIWFVCKLHLPICKENASNAP